MALNLLTWWDFCYVYADLGLASAENMGHIWPPLKSLSSEHRRRALMVRCLLGSIVSILMVPTQYSVFSVQYSLAANIRKTCTAHYAHTPVPPAPPAVPALIAPLPQIAHTTRTAHTARTILATVTTIKNLITGGTPDHRGGLFHLSY